MRLSAVAAPCLFLLSFALTSAASAQFAPGTDFTLPPPPPTPPSSCYGCGDGGGNNGGYRRQSSPPAQAPPTKRDFADPELDSGQAALNSYETTHTYSDFVNAESHLKAALSYLPNWGVPHERLCELYGEAGQYDAALAECRVALDHTGDFKDGRKVKNWLVTNRMPWLFIKIHSKAYEANLAAYKSGCGSSANASLNNGITILEDGGPGVVDMRANSDAQVQKCKDMFAALIVESKSLNNEVALWTRLHP